MVYEEITIPGILKEWEKSFSERYHLFTTKKERDHTFEVILKNQDQAKNAQTHPVTLKVFIKSDTDVEQMTLKGLG